MAFYLLCKVRKIYRYMYILKHTYIHISSDVYLQKMYWYKLTINKHEYKNEWTEYKVWSWEQNFSEYTYIVLHLETNQYFIPSKKLGEKAKSQTLCQTVNKPNRWRIDPL